MVDVDIGVGTYSPPAVDSVERPQAELREKRWEVAKDQAVVAGIDQDSTVENLSQEVGSH